MTEKVICRSCGLGIIPSGYGGTWVGRESPGYESCNPLESDETHEPRSPDRRQRALHAVKNILPLGRPEWVAQWRITE